MKLNDLTGKRFGRLVVLRRGGYSSDKIKWVCKCDCGTIKEIVGTNLTRGITLSCGCLGRERRAKSVTKHGFAKTKLDNTWYGMKARCYNKKEPAYKDYGARGIKICDEWLNDKSSFFEWALKNGYEENLSIDRINNDGDYEPSNCRWVNAKTQCLNRRSNHLITYNGETHTITEWCKIIGLPYSTIGGRIRKGWDIERAFTTKKMKNQFG